MVTKAQNPGATASEMLSKTTLRLWVTTRVRVKVRVRVWETICVLGVKVRVRVGCM